MSLRNPCGAVDLAKKRGTFWTLQQFTEINRKPWYALQEHNDAGVVRQFTGYRHEMDALCRKLCIKPEELPPTTEEEFLRRAAGEMPDDSTPPGRVR